MKVLKDFEQLHISTKTIFLGIILIPIYFMSIYLFKKELIQQVSVNPFYDMDFYFILTLCLGLSITWFSLNLFLSLLSIGVKEIITDIDAEEGDVFIGGLLLSLLILTLSILLNHFIGFTFKNFILITYGYVLLRIIITGFILLRTNYLKETKKENEAKNS